MSIRCIASAPPPLPPSKGLGGGRGGGIPWGGGNAKRRILRSKCSIVGLSVLCLSLLILSSPLMFFCQQILGSKHSKLSRTISYDFFQYSQFININQQQQHQHTHTHPSQCRPPSSSTSSSGAPDSLIVFGVATASLVDWLIDFCLILTAIILSVQHRCTLVILQFSFCVCFHASTSSTIWRPRRL